MVLGPHTVTLVSRTAENSSTLDSRSGVETADSAADRDVGAGAVAELVAALRLSRVKSLRLEQK
jgi:hypothetical protein